MATRHQSDAEFRNEFIEILRKYEAMLDRLLLTLQKLLTRVQSIIAILNSQTKQLEMNPLASTDLSHPQTRPSVYLNPITNITILD